jgi:lysozyme family protein
MTDDDIITGILQREGKQFTNNPLDRQGPTKYGVTQATLSGYLGRPATMQDVQTLDEATARAVYKKLYIIDPRFNLITDDALRVAAIDWGVNSGPETAIHALQAAVGVSQDGILGPATAAAINSASQTHLLLVLSKARAVFIARLCQRDPRQLEFLGGWTIRVWSFLGV